MTETRKTPPADVVFLFDVDNTLLDNDRVQDELREHLQQAYGDRRARPLLGDFRGRCAVELGYADYLGALQRYRLEDLHDPQVLRMANWLVDYPFADRLYPGALEAVAPRAKWGRTVILSDGDAVFQPRKVERSGLWRRLRRPRADLCPQGAGARRRRALAPGAALRDDRRQAAHPRRRQAASGATRSPPSSRGRGTTRSTPRRWPGCRRPTSRSSASPTSRNWICRR